MDNNLHIILWLRVLRQEVISEVISIQVKMSPYGIIANVLDYIIVPVWYNLLQNGYSISLLDKLKK